MGRSLTAAEVFDRRRFMLTAATAGFLAALPTSALSQGEPFKLNYASHAGLFEHSADQDIVDQIEFAADVGFRAWEDNGMRGRDVSEQKRMAVAMERRNMKMGVFVGADLQKHDK